MLPTENERALWDRLSALAESGAEQAAPPQIEGVSQHPSFTDRLAARWAGGTLVLFALSLFSLTLNGVLGDTSSLLLGPPLALVFCWLLAPLSRTRNGFSGALLLLLFLPVGLFTGISQLVPAYLVTGYSSELLPLLIQMALESIFQPSYILTMSVFALLLTLVGLYFRKNNPWVHPGRVGKRRLTLGWLTLLAPFVLAGYFIFTSTPSAEALNWLDQAQLLRVKEADKYPTTDDQKADWVEIETQQSFREIESKADDTESRRRVEDLITSAVPHGLPQREDEQHLIFPLAVKVLEDPKASLTPQQRMELSYLAVTARLKNRPQYQYIDTYGLVAKELIPYLLAPERTNTELWSWLLKLEDLESRIPTPSDEFQLNAADYFLGSHEEPQKMVFAVISGDTPNRKVSQPMGNGTVVTEKPKPRAMPFLFTTIDLSPTQIAFRRDEKKMLEVWLAIQDKPFQEDAVQSSDEVFTDSLFGRRYSDTVGPYLRTAILIARLRLAKLETGQYPEQLPTDPSWNTKRWGWTRAGNLLKTELIGYENANKKPSWVLP